MQSLLQQQALSLAIVSQHAYVTAGVNAGQPVASGFLLLPSSSTLKPALAAPYVAAATAAGKQFRMGEMNSLSSSGQDGVSNAFEAALWATDVMFEYANVGVSGVNFHSNDWNSYNQWDAYAAFHFNVLQAQYQTSGAIPPPPGTQFSSQYSLRELQSLYYGMLFFAEATPHQAKLLPVNLQTSANLKAWATLDPTTGNVNVIIINKEQSTSGSVKLSVPGYSSGVVTHLLAPSFSFRSNASPDGRENQQVRSFRSSKRLHFPACTRIQEKTFT
jgi:hypothetical protein